eukprot:scaffold8437_cov99-Isochrysis_galbana.AAC.2
MREGAIDHGGSVNGSRGGLSAQHAPSEGSTALKERVSGSALAHAPAGPVPPRRPIQRASNRIGAVAGQPCVRVSALSSLVRLGRGASD